MSNSCINYVFESETTGADRLMLFCLADAMDDDGEWSISVGRLAGKANCSESAARRTLRRLEDAGEIRIVVQAGKRTMSGPMNLYQLIRFRQRRGLETAPTAGPEPGRGVASTPGHGGASTPPLGSTGVASALPHGVASTPGHGGASTRPNPLLIPSVTPPRVESTWTPTTEAAPMPQPTPTARRRGRVTVQNIDPRKIGQDGLIAEGSGTTPLEVWREFYSYTPTASQIREMMAIEELGRWRAHVKECAVTRGFRGVGPVLDTFRNGFRQAAAATTAPARNGGRMFDGQQTGSGRGDRPAVERPGDVPESIWKQLNRYAKEQFGKANAKERAEMVAFIRAGSEQHAAAAD